MKGSVAALTSILAAAATAKKCTELKVPVTVSARLGVFDQPIPVTEIEITDYVLDQLQYGVNYTQDILERYTTVTKRIRLAATYCEPDSGPSSALQILTHGIGFDRGYWDLPFKRYNYSYTDVAVDDYGFSTLTYDRPGIGDSSPLDPLNEAQALFEVGALYELTLAAQAGKIHGVPKFTTYTHGGHSFGAQHTYTLTAMYPDISDCITLQGFSQVPDFIPYFGYAANLIQANTLPPLADYATGYFANGAPQAIQYDFFAPGQFDPAILRFAVANGQPVAIGELITIAGETATPNTFPGPAHIVTGERDLPYCGGNCYGPSAGYPSIPSESAQYLVHASPFQVDIIPDAGHALNLEYSHPTTYAVMNDFLIQNGCGPSGYH